MMHTVHTNANYTQMLITHAFIDDAHENDCVTLTSVHVGRQ